MRKIELTIEQKKKLSEMCEILFPEYEFDFSWLNQHQGECPELKYWNNKMKHAEFIHWFEFCVNHLSKKLFDLNKRKEISSLNNYVSDILLGVFKEYEHPVYYLYEEFKKINKKDA